MIAPLIRAHLFGPLALFRDNTGEDSTAHASLPLPSSTIARSLLAYLLLNREHPHPRPVLAGAFWPEIPEVRARRALSQALWQVRRPLPEIVQADTHSIHIPAEAPLWVDIESFLGLVKEGTASVAAGLPTPAVAGPPTPTAAGLPTPTAAGLPTSAVAGLPTSAVAGLPTSAVAGLPTSAVAGLPIEPPGAAAQNLRQAIQLYRGDLLEGFYDDWALLERERLRELYLQALEKLIGLDKAAGRYDQALNLALSLTNADPLQEAAHREVMRLYFVLHRPQAALKQFEVCREILDEELAVAPDAETVALAQEIAGRTSLTVPHLPPVSPPSSSLTEPLQMPLVGRETERAELLAQLEAAFNHLGGVALVEGEAGVGKTRLLQEVARDAEWRGGQVLWGHGREMEGLSPFALLVEALASGLSPLRVGQLAGLMNEIWLQVLSPLLPQLAAALPDLPSLPALDSPQERDRLVNALAQLLSAWGQITPLAFILEDLHWADEDSLDVLIALAQRLRQQSVLIIGSYRGDEARAHPAIWEKLGALDRAGLRHRLILARLEAAATGELIRRSLGLSQTVPAFETRLFQETAGNPLFVLETLRALRDEGLLFQDESGQWRTPWDETTSDYAELPLPPAVERVIARRLTQLPPYPRQLLSVAAVLGSQFDFSLLSAVGQWDTPTLLAALDELVRRHFLEETPQAYRFSHNKVRQVAYLALTKEERQEWHRRTGDTLEVLTPERVEALAYHYDQGDARERALTYTLQAGERAQALYDNRGALAYFERALALAQDPAARWDALNRQSPLLNTLSRHQAQARVLDEMERLAEALADPVRQAQTLYQQGELETMVGDPRRALTLLERGGDLARGAGERILLGACLAAAARAHWRRSDAPACQSAAEESKSLYRQAGHWKGESRALNMLGNLHLGITGDLGRALAYFEQCLDLDREHGDRHGEAISRANLGLTRLMLGDYRPALESLNHTLEFLSRLGDRQREAVTCLWQGCCHRELGDLPQAQLSVEESLSILREIGSPNFEIEALGLLGRIATDRGAYAEARDRFTQALQVAQRNEQQWDTILQRSSLALAWLRLGEVEEARRLATQALGQVEQVGDQRTFIHVVFFEIYQVLAHTEGLAAARPYLERAHQTLMAAAGRIQDPNLRRSFLENIPENRAIVMAHRLGHPPSPIHRPSLRLPRADAPTGRPLRDDEYVDVTWTVSASKDQRIKGKAARRRHRLLRLLQEAQAQGAAPTLADLAAALKVSHATIKRDLSALRAAGHPVKTRGSR